MWRSMGNVAAATALFGVVHSVLASQAVKRAASRRFGVRNRNGLYRVVYIGQSLVTFALLAEYIRRQPSRQLYHVQGPLAYGMHAGQLLAVVYATAAARQVGIARIVGAASLRAWFDRGAVPQEPEAQGPALDGAGLARHAGPFACSRHPLNLAPLPILWLWPRMTTNLLAFNTAATVYLILGSLHEEARLRQAYGARYAAYQHSGARFYVPWPAAGGRCALADATAWRRLAHCPTSAPSVNQARLNRASVSRSPANVVPRSDSRRP